MKRPAASARTARGERQPVASRRGVRPDWHLAPAAQAGDHGPFGRQGGRGGRVVNPMDEVSNGGIARPDLDGDDPLSRRRHARFRRQRRRDAVRVSEPPEAGRGQHECVEIAAIELPQTRVEVSADRFEPCGRKEARELRGAPHAARADPRRVAEAACGLIERGAGARREDDRVAGVLAWQDGADGQPRRQLGWHVLAAVYREIDRAGEQRILDFLDEEPFATDPCQPNLGEPITGGPDDDDLARHAGARPEQVGDGVGLKERERAAARAEPQRSVVHASMFSLLGSCSGSAFPVRSSGFGTLEYGTQGEPEHEPKREKAGG